MTPIPALAEVQVALQEAVAKVTGDRGEALKRRRSAPAPWSLTMTAIGNCGGRRSGGSSTSRAAIAVDMESATVATQGFRMRALRGTLLGACPTSRCAGEIKLPGFRQRLLQ